MRRCLPGARHLRAGLEGLSMSGSSARSKVKTVKTLLETAGDVIGCLARPVLSPALATYAIALAARRARHSWRWKSPESSQGERSKPW